MTKPFEVLRGKMSLKAQLQAKEEAAKILKEIRRSHTKPKPLNDSLNRNLNN